MAAKEMYDYLSTITPTYTTTTLSVTPQKIIIEEADKSQVVHEYDSGSVDVVSFSDDSLFKCTLQWTSLSESDSGTIFDFYNDSDKANGRENTFYWTHVDGHTYVVRFDGPMRRKYTSNLWGTRRTAIAEITLRVEGRKAD